MRLGWCGCGGRSAEGFKPRPPREASAPGLRRPVAAIDKADEGRRGEPGNIGRCGKLRFADDSKRRLESAIVVTVRGFFRTAAGLTFAAIRHLSSNCPARRSTRNRISVAHAIMSPSLARSFETRLGALALSA